MISRELTVLNNFPPSVIKNPSNSFCLILLTSKPTNRGENTNQDVSYCTNVDNVALFDTSVVKNYLNNACSTFLEDLLTARVWPALK